MNGAYITFTEASISRPTGCNFFLLAFHDSQLLFTDAFSAFGVVVDDVTVLRKPLASSPASVSFSLTTAWKLYNNLLLLSQQMEKELLLSWLLEGFWIHLNARGGCSITFANFLFRGCHMWLVLRVSCTTWRFSTKREDPKGDSRFGYFELMIASIKTA